MCIAKEGTTRNYQKKLWGGNHWLKKGSEAEGKVERKVRRDHRGEKYKGRVGIHIENT